MNKKMGLLAAVTTCVSFAGLTRGEKAADPFLWLEEVDGEKALEWVISKNKSTSDFLQQDPVFPALYETNLKILNSTERIANPTIRGEYIYNFWKDETAERGLWRRVPFQGFFESLPKWETVLDMDALCEKEGEKWVFKGVSVLSPDYDIGMLRLSRGGSDAVVIREFNLRTKSFVEGGFFIDEAKSRTSWIDRDTLLISTDFGEGSTTSSGYPRIVKIWKRGTPLTEAKTLFKGEHEDVSISGTVIHTPERNYVIVTRRMSFYQCTYFVLENGVLQKLELPEDADIQALFKGQLLVELKSDWETEEHTYKQGALMSIDYDRFLAGDRKFDVLFDPEDRASLGSVSTTENHLLVTLFRNGQYDDLFTCFLEKGKWVKRKDGALQQGTISVVATDDFSDRHFLTYESLLTPRSLYYIPGNGQPMKKAKSLPDYFNADDFRVEHFESTSKDGTKIPYSLILPKTAKLDGLNPTLLYGYGGFEVSIRPRYYSLIGASWLARGGVFVVSHIRGGGEFGPNWHQAAKKENKQRSYDDFISISEDLIKRGICSSKTLGIMGGSNGGLLVGAAFTQRPDLYNAVVCSVPLLDMKRYSKLLAGASWMAEYGNPNIPEEWAYIKKYSPYHNLLASKEYPKVFFKTTTRDDRVHPGHARKMAAKMESQGHKIFYFENTEGGHGSGVTNKQLALIEGLTFTYLLQMLTP